MLKFLCQRRPSAGICAAIAIGVCAAFLLPISAAAQAPFLQFRNLGVEDGLAQTSVHSFFQDSQGFMWIATQDGLDRWDGNRFLSYRHDPNKPDATLSHSRVRAITEQDGLLWLGTDAGTIDTLDLQTREIRHLLNADELAPLTGPIRDFSWQDHRLWIAGASGLAVLDTQTDEFLSWRPQNLPADFIIFELDQAHGGRLWLSTSQGLSRVSLGPGGIVVQPCPQLDSILTASYTTADDQLWVAGPDRVVMVDAEGRPALTRKLPYRQQLRVSSLLIDELGRIWVGTGNGLILWDPEQERYFNYTKDPSSSYGLADDEIYCLYRDRSGQIWIGSLGGGVDRWHPVSATFPQFPGYFELKKPSVYSLGETLNGDLWAGIREGLLRWNRKTGEMAVISQGQGPNGPVDIGHPMSLLGDRSGYLWIGRRRSTVLRLAPETLEITLFDSAQERPGSSRISGVMSFFESSRNELFLGTGGTGLVRLNRETRVFEPIAQGDEPWQVQNSFIAKIVEMPAGRLWLAGYRDGLESLDLKEKTALSFKHDPGNPRSMPTNTLSTLHLSDEGRLWIGTVGSGIARLERFDESTGEATFRSWNESHGLANNTVHGVLSDATGSIWVSTGRGLSRFQPETEHFESFSFIYGLQENEFNFGAYLETRAGDLFFGGPKGWNQVDLHRLSRPSQPPSMALAGLQINNRAVDLPTRLNEGHPLQLSYRDSTLRFDVTALDFHDPSANRYQYQLEGFDESWIEMEEYRPVVYTNLDPGRYVFRARAANSRGQWNERGLAIPMRVERAPWESWWAWCVYLAAGLGLVYSGVRWRLGALERRSVELKEQVDQRTLELRDTVHQLRESEASALNAKRRAVKSLEEALDERRKAQEADQAKSVFLSNMSHELRTPLNAVLGFAQLMERDPSLGSAHRDSLKVILRSGEHLLSLINDVLSLAKIEAGRLSLGEEPFLLHELCRDVVGMVSGEAEEKGLAVHFEGMGVTPQAVIGDRGRLMQVLINLLGNAVKFTERGSVTLRLSMKAHLVDFAIIDSGVGIGADEIHKLFEPFHQTESGRRSKEGTGLGLAISERLVELMGGALRVDSELGRGSTFAFSLPLPTTTPDRVEKPSGRVVGLRLDKKPPKVLAVDDTAENLALLRRLFKQVGLPVKTARNGEEAVGVWRQWRPSLIWMDMRMPGIDGYEATRRIRAEEADLVTGRTVIVALTAAAFEDDRQEILACGCDDVITKPYQEHMLFETMARHLDLTYIYEESGDTVSEPDGSASEESEVEPPHSSPCRVLVAEDNPSNQVVARRMLNRLGIQPDMVNNGKLALEAAERQDYELLLMDIRMPKMDGLEAARRLRESRGDRPRPVIIALTGLAGDDERQLCLDAGMDDLLAKPFRIEELDSKLRKWLPDSYPDDRPPLHEGVPAPGSIASGGSENLKRVPLDRQKLHQLQELDDGTGAKPLAVQVISLFLETVPGQLKELQKAIKNRDFRRLRTVAHSLKNSSSTLGAEDVSAACKRLETLGRSSDSDAALVAAQKELDALMMTVQPTLRALAQEKVDASASYLKKLPVDVTNA